MGARMGLSGADVGSLSAVRCAAVPCAPGAAIQLVIGSPNPLSPGITDDVAPFRTLARAALVISPGTHLREAALVQYSPLYCVVLNYAALNRPPRTCPSSRPDTVAAGTIDIRPPRVHVAIPSTCTDQKVVAHATNT